MNLLGEGFPQEIIDQINQRQTVHGSGYSSLRTDKDLSYLNANTSWCKLVSSVNIDNNLILNNESLRKLSNIGGNRLANEFMLFNGTDNVNSPSLRSGISENNTVVNGNAYGLGGNEFGLNPMMGIENVTVKHENRGSLRRANVKIKCFNKIQFDIIDALYLRLGFSLLLEWGHSLYINNKGELVDGINGLASAFLEPKNLTYLDFLRTIDILRKNSCGNYDAMFAKVSNFHWTFNRDGSYDITLDLVSVGDIIESLKLNSFSGTLPITSNEATPIEENTFTLLKKAKNTDIGEILNKLTDLLGGELYIKQKNNAENSQSWVNLFEEKPDTNQQLTGLASLDDISAGLSKTNKVDAIKKIYKGVKNPFYYLRLGALLQIIQEKIIYNIGKQNQLSTSLKVDFNSLTNLMYVDELQVSLDPTICLVNKNLIASGDTSSTTDILHFTDGEPFLIQDKSFNPPSKSTYGQIMNIYVNFEFILKKMEELKDNKNQTLIIDFLKGILDGINGAMGGINNFDIFIDETANTLKILDINPLPDTNELIKYVNQFTEDKLNDKFANFKLFGYSPDNKAGFIKDFSFKTELSPATSTMITIGAAANSTVVGENATAFSRLNSGLTDRFKETMSSPQLQETTKKDSLNKTFPIWADFGTQQDNTQPNEIQTAYQELKNQYAGKYGQFLIFLRDLAGKNSSKTQTLVEDDISTYKDMLTNLIQLRQQRDKKRLEQKYIKDKKNPNKIISLSTGFIPFNLSLTMNGISGMKINSKFIMDSSYLPTNYTDTVDFLIKNISHTISNNKWLTSIESYCISQGTTQSENEININPNNQISKQTPIQSNNLSNINTVTSCIDEAKIKLSSNYDLSQLSCNAVVAKYSIPKEGEQKVVTPLSPLSRQNIIDNLTQVAQNVLEPIRAKYPDLIVTNGYRNKGGVSQHEKGEAVDIQFQNILNKSIILQQSEMVERAKNIKQLLSNKKGFDQLLLEFRSTGGNPWIHISFKSSGNRNDYNTFLNDVLAKNGKNNLINPFV